MSNVIITIWREEKERDRIGFYDSGDSVQFSYGTRDAFEHNGGCLSDELLLSAESLSSLYVPAVRQPTEPFNLLTRMLGPWSVHQDSKGEDPFTHPCPHFCSFAVDPALALHVPTSDFLLVQEPKLRLIRLQSSISKAISKLTVTTRPSLLMQMSSRLRLPA